MCFEKLRHPLDLTFHLDDSIKIRNSYPMMYGEFFRPQLIVDERVQTTGIVSEDILGIPSVDTEDPTRPESVGSYQH
jgi:hypothetical protein